MTIFPSMVISCDEFGAAFRARSGPRGCGLGLREWVLWVESLRGCLMLLFFGVRYGALMEGFGHFGAFCEWGDWV